MMSVNAKKELNIIDWWHKLSHNWKKTFLFNLDFSNVDYGTNEFFPDLYNTYYKKFGMGIRRRLDDFDPNEENILNILNLDKILVKHPEIKNIDPLHALRQIKSLTISGTEIINLRGLTLPELENLTLSCPYLYSLEGIEGFKNLRSLKLIYCYKVMNLDSVFKCEEIETIDLRYIGTLDAVKSFIDSFYRQKVENNLPFYKMKFSEIVTLPCNISL